MGSRFRPHFFARDYDIHVVAKGKCLLEAPPSQYKPLFTIQEFPSFGFRTLFSSWIVNRPVHTVSMPEYHRLLGWHEPGLGVVNICEQFGLHPNLTREIAWELGVKHPAIQGQSTIMSTDFVVTYCRPGGRLERCAYAVKCVKDLTARTIQKLAIEQAYWAARNTRWSLVLDENIPAQLVRNMELLIEFADRERLPCESFFVPVIKSWLVPALCSGLPLRVACARCDDVLHLLPGTALSVAYHLIVRGALPFGLRQGHLPLMSLEGLRIAA